MWTIPSNNIDEDHILDFQRIDNSGTVFEASQLNKTEKTLTIHDCEQLLYGFCFTTAGYTIILDPTEGGFFFQNYDGLKEGINSKLAPGSVTIEPKSNENVLVQGLQITATNFIATTTTLAVINNIYFKDCVHTKTSNTATVSGGIFKDCKFSMHIRAAEYTPQLTAGTFYRCAGYFTLSDLKESAAGEPNVFTGTHEQCSFIVRNLAVSSFSSGSSTLVKNSTNCSYDIEMYVVKMPSSTAKNLALSGINNCFLSIKIDKVIDANLEVPSDNAKAILIKMSNMSGVNIINGGDDGNITIPDIESNNNVKQLTESECKNYEILNKWGFFTNKVEEDDS